MLGLPAVAHASAPGKAAFVIGAFGASLAWQSTLAGGGALMRHGLPASARTWTSVAGRVLVLALALSWRWARRGAPRHPVRPSRLRAATGAGGLSPDPTSANAPASGCVLHERRHAPLRPHAPRE